MPPRKRKVMPLGDSSNRIRPRTPDARVERSADKSASLKSTTGIIENDEIARPAHNRAVVALPEETVKSEQHTPSSFFSQAATAIESPSPMKPAGETTGCVTTTPPRPPQQPPTVVETCPTPPSSSSAAPTPSRRARRRPLLDAHVDGRIVGDEAVLPSSSSSSLPLEIRTPGLFETAEQVNPTTMAAANADVARKGSLDLPNGWRQTDPTFARLPRRTPRHSTDTTTSTPPLPDLNPANLISALLAQSLPVSGPRRNSGDLPRSAATSLRSERHQTEKSRSLRSGRATPVSTGAGLSPPPLENRSRPVSPRSPPPPPLRPQPSTTTLFSWDLAHLPAPDAPREKPYRVSWKSVLLPTRYLGGGRGSGRYGDQWGPVERKGAARSSLAAAALEGARSHHAGGEKEDETVVFTVIGGGSRNSSSEGIFFRSELLSDIGTTWR
ncbi:hypothetical protein RHOSPDRAFT_23980 [Rhodotorula sp. JG-1b]|nr:hypothetical protein RHOSPDRAFT_23980 [Rhodotorula sp. JG-1b]